MARHAHRKKHKRIKAPPREHLGSPAGTIHPPLDANPTAIRRFRYNGSDLSEHPVTDVSTLKKPDGSRAYIEWIDVDGLQDVEKIKQIGKIYGLHALALADVVHRRQQPKAEAYGNILFIVLRLVHPTSAGADYEQVSLFLGPDFVITFQETQEDCFDWVRERLKEHQGKIREQGADYLAYCLIDAIIDDYYPLVERFSDDLDAMERQVIEGLQEGVLDRLADLKREFQSLERNLRPARDAITALAAVPSNLVSDDTKLYLRDCQDHVLQLYDTAQVLRESAAHLVQIYLGISSQRLNEVMKFLTIITTIFIPLTFIAGIYGMNFDPDSSPLNMPELRWVFGYPATMAVMVVIALGMIVFFRHKGWLGPKSRKGAKDDLNEND